jgi:anti-anti-sigma regulatory factor
MIVSSRTPEGEPGLCNVCGRILQVLISDPQKDACCPFCGSLVNTQGLCVLEISISDRDNLDDLRLQISKLNCKLLVNLGNLTFISDRFTELLIEYCEANRSAKRIAFYGILENLEEVLSITRISKLVEIYPDNQTALRALLT